MATPPAMPTTIRMVLRVFTAVSINNTPSTPLVLVASANKSSIVWNASEPGTRGIMPGMTKITGGACQIRPKTIPKKPTVVAPKKVAATISTTPKVVNNVRTPYANEPLKAQANKARFRYVKQDCKTQGSHSRPGDIFDQQPSVHTPRIPVSSIARINPKAMDKMIKTPFIALARPTIVCPLKRSSTALMKGTPGISIKTEAANAVAH